MKVDWLLSLGVGAEGDQKKMSEEKKMSRKKILKVCFVRLRKSRNVGLFVGEIIETNS